MPTAKKPTPPAEDHHCKFDDAMRFVQAMVGKPAAERNDQELKAYIAALDVIAEHLKPQSQS